MIAATMDFPAVTRIARSTLRLVVDRARGTRHAFAVHHLITWRCNLRCTQCGGADGDWSATPCGGAADIEMDRFGVRAFYRQLLAAGFGIAVVGGGEPLLRDDLDDVLRVLRGRVFVAIATNGTLLAERTGLV